MSKITCNAFLDVKSFLKRVRKCMHDITSHSTFDAVTVTLIVLNTIVLALYYHGIHPQFRNVLDNVNLVSVSPASPYPWLVCRVCVHVFRGRTSTPTKKTFTKKNNTCIANGYKVIP